jgi:outer membrane receptor protein involved in Fe transport
MGRILPCLAVLLSLSVPSAFSQVSISGKITGVVTDSSGGAIRGAKVTVESPALMTAKTASSQGDGEFLLDLLPPGTYTVSVESAGFKRFVQKDLSLQAGFTASVQAQMQPGDVQQSVTVSDAPDVDVQTVTSSTTFNQTLLQDIPSGRDPWSTVAQAPGVTSSTVDVAGNQSYQQSYMQVHGSLPGEEQYSWNGLRLGWPGSNGGYTSFYINQDSLQEFQVVTDQAPAEVGVGGVYMNMVTKSGSNQIHGLLADYYLTSALQAQPELPTYNGQQVQAGSPFVMSEDSTASLGLPLIKDRWWLFGSFQRYDIREDILAVRLPDGSPINDINHQSNVDTRSDWQLNSRNRASFVWLYNSENRFFRRDTSYQFVSQQASWRQIEPAYILEGLWTSQLTNALVLDVRVGYMHQIFPLSYQPSVGPNSYNAVDLTLSTESGAPPYSYVNPASHGRVSATASYYKSAWAGSHDIKFGFEYGRQKNGNLYNVNQGLTAIYNNGAPLEVSVFNSPVDAYSIIHDSSVFAQDAWHVARRLTLNLGVRYDHFLNFNPAQSSPTDGLFVSLFGGTRSYPQSANIVDWNNVAPRLGAAYDLTGKGRSVLRAAYSRFYRIEGTELAEAVNPNTLSSVTYLWNGQMTNGIPSGFISPANLVSTSGGVYTTIDPHLKHPYSDEVTVGWQQQFRGNLAVGAQYFFRDNKNQIGQIDTTRVPADYTPITTLNGSPIMNPVTNTALTLYNLMPGVASETSHYEVTNIKELDQYRYDGVEFTATKHLSSKWQVLAGFTIQRGKGTYGNGTPNALYDDFNDPNLNINRLNNYLFLDSTYVFKIDATYQLPLRIATSINFQHYTGYPIRPQEVFTGLNQGSETIALEPAGNLRLPSVNLLDLRVGRPFTFRDRWKIEPDIDLFNVTNSNTVTSLVTTYGSSYLYPTNVLNPFVARLGLRVSF